MKSYLDLSYGTLAEQTFDLFLPEGDRFPLIIYFHGGGLEAGNKTMPQSFSEYLTANGVAVASANYRMYPTAKYPEFIDDAARCVAYLKDAIGEYGTCEGIYVGGSSAGGYLSQMLCFDGSYLEKYGASVFDVAGFLHDAGQPTTHFNVLRERGMDTRRIVVDEAAPLYYVGTREKNPPMLFITATNDMENRVEQTELVLSTIRHFGTKGEVLYKQMRGNHCYYTYLPDGDGVIALGKIFLAYLRRHDEEYQGYFN